MELITSPQNSYIKEVKALRQKKSREEKKRFFIEGERFVEESLKEKVKILYIFVSDSFLATVSAFKILEKIHQNPCPIYQISDKLFQEISDTENPQGILAVMEMQNYALFDVVKENSFIVLLDSIQDPGNLGTIIRTADAAGASGIIYSKGSVDLYNPKVLRATMGSVFHLPVVYSENLSDTIRELKGKGVKLLAAHLKGEMPYFHEDLKGPVGIIIGNEANGISEEVACHADAFVRIPMDGKAESLNASVAAGILMYEVLRQRSLY